MTNTSDGLAERSLDDVLARFDDIVSRHTSEITDHVAAITPRRNAVSGRTLAHARMTTASRARYDALLFFETKLRDAEEALELDHSMLALCGCQILEDQLAAILVPIVRRGGASLVELVVRDDHPGKTLRAWFDGAVPITLGVLVSIVVGLRRGLERSAEQSATWLHGPMTLAFDGVLVSKGLEKAINTLRGDFRNPLAHATTTLDRTSYRTFCALLVGGQDMTSWDVRGPTPNPPLPHRAVLHHLLAGLV